MQLRPRFYQPPLPPRQEAGNQFDRVETEDRHIFLIVGVKMWHVMTPGSANIRITIPKNRLISGTHHYNPRDPAPLRD
jgi:hypothetical protein